MAITKVLDFNSVDSTGEPVARLVTPGLRERLTKTAEGVSFTPAIKQFLSGLKPEKNKVYVLVNAMGASEFFGPNINGDAFSEEVLRKYHPTFVTNGKPFMHHMNKDPEKSYGKVLCSDYNDVMHRVELVIEYDERLDKKYIDKINNGDLVTVSMGCRVPYDICSCCMHKAESPDKYCDHLKSNPGLGRMLPDGRRAFAINTEPTFFDISIVTVPADPTARVLLKIASQKNGITKSAADRADELGVTKAAESVTQKLDTYKANKTINANDIAANFDPVYNELAQAFDKSMGPGISKECLNAIGESSSDIFSTLKSLIDDKMFLRPQETQRIVLVACGKHDVADELDNAKITLGNDPSSVIPKIISAISGGSLLDMIPPEIRGQRSMTPENVKRIVIRMHLPEKTASMIDVPVSDAYRELAGEPRIREEVPTILTNPLDALKSYLALGSIITAFNSLMGKAVAPGLLSAAGISALVGPQALYMMRKVDESVNRPSQRMVFDDRDSPENIERAIMSALAQSEERLRQKLGGLESVAPLSSKALLAIPLAFGASKLMSSKAKESAIEEAQMTGKYEPGILSKQEWTFPLALGLILKYSSARKKVNEYIKTAEKCFRRPFPEILRKNEEDVYRALNGILFS